MTYKPKRPVSKAYHPVPYDKADTAAIQALAGGTATPEQQIRALHWIIIEACAKDNWAYSIDDERETNIFLGRQFVGHQIVKQINLSRTVFKEKNDDRSSTTKPDANQ